MPYQQYFNPPAPELDTLTTRAVSTGVRKQGNAWVCKLTASAPKMPIDPDTNKGSNILTYFIFFAGYVVFLHSMCSCFCMFSL